MPNYRAQVIIRTVDNIAENFITNSWCLNVAAGTPDYTGIAAAFDAFYSNLDVYFSPAVAQTGHEIRFYALPGTPPNYPITNRFFDLSLQPSGTALPREVALVLSFQALKSAGVNQRRRKGRVYIGPLDSSGSGGERPTSALRSDLANAAVGLQTAFTALTLDTTWSIWSEANQTASPVRDGWVDDAWDTQRRRGLDASTRTTFVV